jgi:hypothetical protein
MTFRLLSHVNRDDDFIEMWLRYYLRLGVGSFHVIAHGGREENKTLYSLVGSYPIEILDAYTGPFHVFEKRDRLNWALGKLGGGWMVLVDSDELVELPYPTLSRTVHMMRWLRADAISAPMLQRFAANGSADAAAAASPFESYPWCSVDLYARLGQPQAIIDKYPLFLVSRRTSLRSGGNHYPPNGLGSRIAPMLGVTHHFKWRPAVHGRLVDRVSGSHPYRHESVQYLSYLEQVGWRLPTEGAFLYSRRELFRRGLLSRPKPADFLLRRSRLSTLRGGRGSVFDHLVSPARLAEDIERAGFGSVALCGAGSGGLLFLKALRARNIMVSHVVDRDSSRWNTLFEGIRVSGLDTVLEAGQHAFVTGSLSYGAEMEAGVRRRADELGIPVTVFSTASYGGGG